MKPTNQNLATFYGVHKNCISNYKNGDEFKKRLYQAMKDYFIKHTLDLNQGHSF